jgi:hypothetical protein
MTLELSRPKLLPSLKRTVKLRSIGGLESGSVLVKNRFSRTLATVKPRYSVSQMASDYKS